jgi:hypothetical protein
VPTVSGANSRNDPRSIGTATGVAENNSSIIGAGKTGSNASRPAIAGTTEAVASPATTGQTSTVPKVIDRSGTPADGEKRMRDLERKLEKLLKDVDDLRQEIRGRRQSSGDAKTPADPILRPSAGAVQR